MKKWVMIIDIKRCHDCNNCFLACKDEHCGNHWSGYTDPQPLHGHRWINILSKERGQFPLVDMAYLPKPCMHCDDAPCIEASRNGAVFQRQDGIVIIDPNKAKGQRAIMNACPYGAVWWNDELNLPQKCTFCAHLIDNHWKAPRCVQACPTGALSTHFIDDLRLDQLIKNHSLERMNNHSTSAKPRVFYKNLYRYTHCFIRGSVAVRKNGVEDCLPNAKVGLFKASKWIENTRTDIFGDFCFDKLAPNSGRYEIKIEYDPRNTKILEVELISSLSLETVWFELF